MKHWTLAALKQVLAGKNLQEFARPRLPAPFPGKFPTRIYFRAKGFEYFGKPSTTAFQAMRKAWSRGMYDYTTIEFDKAGPIYLNGRVGPKDYQALAHNESCWAVYHPQTCPDVTLSWMSYGIRTLGHRYVIGAEGIRGVR